MVFNLFLAGKKIAFSVLHYLLTTFLGVRNVYLKTQTNGEYVGFKNFVLSLLLWVVWIEILYDRGIDPIFLYVHTYEFLLPFDIQNRVST